jgi:hypothetical protein
MPGVDEMLQKLNEPLGGEHKQDVEVTLQVEADKDYTIEPTTTASNSSQSQNTDDNV